MFNIRSSKIILIGLTLMAVLLVGCDALPTPTSIATPAQDTGTIYTQAAQTVVAELTQNAPPTVVPTSPPTPTSAPTPTLPPPSIPEAIFVDDFNNDTGWSTEKNDQYGFELIEGGYFVYINIPSAQIYSIRSLEVDEIRLSTDAARIVGPEDGYYGVVCRFQDGNNYYTLVISDDGSYGIAKMEDGAFSFIQEGVDEGGFIQGDGATNRVRGDCVGQTLTLYANDRQLLQVQDATFTEGLVGLLAGTRDIPGLRVMFTSFAILGE
jgi:hypothetical protein